MLWSLKQKPTDDKHQRWKEKLFAEGKLKKDPRPKQEDIPHILPRCLWIWRAYCDLSERRGVGPNGPVPVTIEAMDAYSRLTQRTERFYIDQLLHFVPLLDRVYLRDFYDRQVVEMEKARRQANKPTRSRIGL